MYTVQPNAALALQKGQKILPGRRTALQVRLTGKYLVSRAAEYRHGTEICDPPRVSPIGDALITFVCIQTGTSFSSILSFPCIIERTPLTTKL